MYRTWQDIILAFLITTVAIPWMYGWTRALDALHDQEAWYDFYLEALHTQGTHILSERYFMAKFLLFALIVYYSGYGSYIRANYLLLVVCATGSLIVTGTLGTILNKATQKITSAAWKHTRHVFMTTMTIRIVYGFSYILMMIFNEDQFDLWVHVYHLAVMNLYMFVSKSVLGKDGWLFQKLSHAADYRLYAMCAVVCMSIAAMYANNDFVIFSEAFFIVLTKQIFDIAKMEGVIVQVNHNADFYTHWLGRVSAVISPIYQCIKSIIVRFYIAMISFIYRSIIVRFYAVDNTQQGNTQEGNTQEGNEHATVPFVFDSPPRATPIRPDYDAQDSDATKAPSRVNAQRSLAFQRLPYSRAHTPDGSEDIQAQPRPQEAPLPIPQALDSLNNGTITLSEEAKKIVRQALRKAAKKEREEKRKLDAEMKKFAESEATTDRAAALSVLHEIAVGSKRPREETEEAPSGGSGQ